jgi:chaperonin cofactor prefoldin
VRGPPIRPAPAAAPPEDDPGAMYAEVEQQKQVIDEQKQQVEAQYRDDKDTREQLKKVLEDEKRAIEEQRSQLGC